MPKKVVSFAGVQSVDLVDLVKKIERQAISDETRKTYESKLAVYRQFLDAVNDDRPILPIDPERVKQCFSYLVEHGDVHNIGYIKLLLAALRNYARAVDCPSVQLIDTENVHSSFGRYWTGLQKTIPEHTPTPKKALAPEILDRVIAETLESHSAENEELICRDILMLLFAFLGVKRAGCVCKSNIDAITVNSLENRLEIEIFKGKDSKKKGKKFFVALDQPQLDLLNIFTCYREFIDRLYAEGKLTNDKYGKKFSITCQQTTKGSLFGKTTGCLPQFSLKCCAKN